MMTSLRPHVTVFTMDHLNRILEAAFLSFQIPNEESPQPSQDSAPLLRLAELEVEAGRMSLEDFSSCQLDQFALRVGVGESFVLWEGQNEILEHNICIVDRTKYNMKLVVSLLAVDSSSNLAFTLLSREHIFLRGKDGTYRGQYDDYEGQYLSWLTDLKEAYDIPQEWDLWIQGRWHSWGKIWYRPKEEKPSVEFSTHYGRYKVPVSPALLRDMKIMRTSSSFQKLMLRALELINTR